MLYEVITVVRVHPELLVAQKLPPASIDGAFWQRRFWNQQCIPDLFSLVEYRFRCLV